METVEQQLLSKMDMMTDRIANLERLMKQEQGAPMTREEAAAFFQCSPYRIDELRRKGKLTYFYLAGGEESDRGIRFRKEDLLDYAKRHRVGVQSDVQ